MNYSDFPNGVRFDALNQDWEATPDKWGTFGVHDPSMLEADGVYYVFSTGTFRRAMCQIRRSKDRDPRRIFRTETRRGYAQKHLRRRRAHRKPLGARRFEGLRRQILAVRLLHGRIRQ